MALQFKCRTCSEEGTIYLPDRGYHVCLEHAPTDERQVPAYSGFEPLSLIEHAVELAKLDQRGEVESDGER